MSEHELQTAANKARKPVNIKVSSENEFEQDQAQHMRAGVYELLSALLAREPEQALLDTLAGIDEVDTSDGQLAMGWELLRQASGKTDASQLKEEYFDLFLGVGRGELVPFGSWYITGFLMEKPVSVLRSDLDLLGIERQQGVSESEDHIAGLCDAMALIIRHPDEISFERQKKFFADHLQPWAKRFFGDLQTAKAARFYRSAGFFGEAFIAFEEQLFEMHT